MGDSLPTALHQGQIVADRWVVVRPFDLAWGRGAVVRDPLWNGAMLDLVLAPPGAEDAFTAAAARWRALPPHPSVVPGFQTVPIEGRPAFFALHPTGTRLDTLLTARWRPLEEVEGFRVAARIAHALAHIHREGLVHGHLEPAACSLGDRNLVQLTRLHLSGQAANPLYRAPELWAGGRPGPPADVYALGVLIYEILAGKRPFDVTARAREAWAAIGRRASGLARVARWLRGQRYQATFPPHLATALSAASLDADTELALLAHFHAEIHLPPPDLDPSLPFACRRLVERCLAKGPADRPTAIEVADELQLLARRAPDELSADELESAVNQTAVAYAEMGETEEARARLDAWLALHPGSVHAWINRALLDIAVRPDTVHQLEQRFDEAVRPFHPAVDADPEVSAFLARLRLLTVHDDGAVCAMSVQPAGRTAAVAWTSGPRVCLWDLVDRRGTRMLHLGGGGAVDDLFLAPGDLLLVRVGRRLAVHEAESLRVVWTRVQPGNVDGTGVSRNGAVALIAGSAGIERVNVANGERLARFELPAGLTGPLRHLAVDPDAQRVAAVAASRRPDEAAVRWERVVLDARSGELLLEEALDGEPVAQAFLGSGGTLATAWADRLEIARPGETPLRRPLPDPDLCALGRSLDGRVLATGHRSGRITVWDAGTGLPARQLPGAGSPVTRLAFSPDAEQLLVGDAAGRVRTWEVKPGRWPWLVRGVPGGSAVRQGSIHRATQDRSLVLHDEGLAAGIVLAPTGARLDWTTSYEGAISAVAMSRDGAWVVVAERHTAHLSQIAGRRVHLDQRHHAHEAEVLAVAFDGTAGRLVVGTGLPVAAGPPERTAGPSARLTRLDSDAAVAHALVAAHVTIGRSPDCGIVLADPSVSRLHCSITFAAGAYVLRDEGSANGTKLNGTPCEGSVLHDGDVVGVGAIDLVFRVGGGEELAVTLPVLPRRETEMVEQATLEYDTAILSGPVGERAPRRSTARAHPVALPAPRSCPALVWDRDPAQLGLTLAGHGAPVRAVAFTRDGTRVVTASEDGTTRVWSVASGVQLAVFPEPGGPPLTSVAVSPDDAWVATGRADGTTVVWDLAGGRPLRELAGHRLEVSGVCFSGDGRLLATGSRDGTARVWRCWTGRPVVTFLGHTGPVTEVAFSPDDRLLLTGSLDGSARLWSRQDGRCLHQIELRAGVTAMDFSGDGRLLVTGGEDGSVQAWVIKCVWIYLDELVYTAEETVDDPRRGAGVWPAAQRPDLDFWLDVWRDLGRCGAVEVSPDLHARYLRVRTRVLYRVVEWLREHGHAPRLALGPRAAHGSAPPEGEALGIDSPLLAISQADPELAAQLRMHLAI